MRVTDRRRCPGGTGPQGPVSARAALRGLLLLALVPLAMACESTGLNLEATDPATTADDAADTSTSSSTPLLISPASATLLVSGTQTFTALGGEGPYTFSVLVGGGTLSSSATSTVFTASASAGTPIIQVTDAAGGSALATVRVNSTSSSADSNLAIVPTTKTLGASTSFTFAGTGGATPYTYSIATGGGSINASTGQYVAPASIGAAIIRLTDAQGDVSDCSVTIQAPLALSPASASLAVNGTTTFTGSGGAGSYTYALHSGTGSINAATGVYTAPASAGSAVVKVTDSSSNVAYSSVTTYATLALNTSSVTLAVNGTYTFSASGGVSPYSYAVTLGGGSIASSGLFTAGGAASNSVVRVTDAVGNVDYASVVTQQTLSLSPASKLLAASGTATFTASGGSGTYTYAIHSGTGSINATTGVYTAPASAGSAVVKVTDSSSNVAYASVTVYDPLTLSPSSATVTVNGTTTFTAANGVSPYTYAVTSGGGSIASSGLFTAGAAASSSVVRVTDAEGNVAYASVTTESTLTLSPASTSVRVNGTTTFAAAGGGGTYTFAIHSGTGSIHATTGVYTAPAGAGSAVVKVTDSSANVAYASVTVYATLALNASSVTLTVNGTYAFSASGGVSPYAYAVTSGGGSIAGTGLFTAGASASSSVVRVTDAAGNVAYASVTTESTLTLSPASTSLAVNATTTFTAAGGGGTYTYAIHSGTGSIDGTTGVYTAPAGAGSAVVKVTDSSANVAYASVTVYATLALDATTVKLAVNGTHAYVASGGVPPYAYAVTLGTGSIDAAGLFTAGNTSVSSSVVRVTDSAGNVAYSNVTTNPVVAVSPSTFSMAVNNTKTFVATGGSESYTWSMAAGTGSIDATTGVYTAPAINGTATVRATDSLGNSATAAVTVNSTLAISPTTKSLLKNGTTTFTATGGSGSYTYSVVTAGGGTIVAATGAYTAPSSAGGPFTIRVTDSIGNTSNATLTILDSSTLALSPTAVGMDKGTSQTFTASGGTAPYTYSIDSGGGTINASTGAYTAPSSSATVVIRVTDATDYSVTSAVRVYDMVGIGSLAAWYSADALTGFNDGDSISSVTDRSGNGYTLEQSDGTRAPVYRTGVLNGKPALRFDYLDDALVITSAGGKAIANAKQGLTVFAVSAAYYDHAVERTLVNISTAVSANPRLYMSRYLSVGSVHAKYLRVRTLDGDSTQTLSASPDAGGAPSIDAAVVSYSDKTADYFSNGVAAGSLSLVTGSGASPVVTEATDSAIISIGGNNTADSRSLRGDLFELLIFNKKLSGAERLSVESYLADKYGIYHSSAIWPDHSGYSATLRSFVGTNRLTKEVADAYKSIGLDYFPEMHLDAGQFRGLTSGVSLSTKATPWIDVSGNGYHANSANGYTAASNGVTYQKSVINGYPVVRTTTGGYYLTQSLPNTAFTGSVSQFIVAKVNPSTTGCVFMQYYTGNYCHAVKLDSAGSQVTIGRGATATDTTLSTAASVNSFNVISYVQTNTTGSLKINGGAAATGTMSTSSTPPNVGGSMGYYSACGCTDFAGDIAEILVYPYSFDATQRLAVENYLRTKYGL